MLKILPPYDADKTDKAMPNDTAVNKSFDKNKMCKTWKDPDPFWFGIQMESRIRISIKTMLIHNTDHITRQNSPLVTLINNVRFLVT
jgi:hypothetical protein